MADFDRESMMEMFTFEMSQLVAQLEQILIQAESGYSMDQINEIFRIMHTIKGSSAMMKFDNIATVAHSVEDLFYFLREGNPQGIDYSRLTDHVLEGTDFIKGEFEKIEAGELADGDGTEIIQRIKNYLSELKGSSAEAKAVKPASMPAISKSNTNDSATGMNKYKAKVFFEDGCEMENVRAFTLIHNIENEISLISTIPEDVINENSIEIIRKDGFIVEFYSKSDYNAIKELLEKTVYLDRLELKELTKTPVLETKENDSKKAIFRAKVVFEDGAAMENVRAYALIHNLEEQQIENISHEPMDIMDETSILDIKANGFKLTFESTKTYEEIEALLNTTVYLKELSLEEVKETSATKLTDNIAEKPPVIDTISNKTPSATVSKKVATPAAVITVSVTKLDQLLNLMGELVIAEAMVTQNPELESLELESFYKEALQLRKIINDVQDTVMSMRMVPLGPTFAKMHRIVRDMCKQLGKDVELVIVGEDTEVDKNITEHIADPLMHIIRNAVDHGIETPEKRKELNKSLKGRIILEAKNSGGDVLILVRDDGSGLDREKIMKKAITNNLLKKPESEYTDKEIQQFVFMPGFSTNEKVTSFSGRGVGMDVVVTNLDVVGGSVVVDSVKGSGSVFTLKIPLTLAIIEGMTIKMGGAKYTIPIISIKQSFKAKNEDIFTDPSGNEMVTVRGEVYNLIRLYEFFNLETEVKNVEDGIVIMLENGDQTVCILVDELIGEQQVVVKTIPKYIKKVRGISGCTLLGNGDISLIIDVVGFFNK